MPVAVFTHPVCIQHDPGPAHAERPERLSVVLDRLSSEPWVDLREAPEASRDELERTHEPAYLDMLQRVAEDGGGVLDADTIMSAASWSAAVRAAGGALAAVTHALSGAGNAFVATRPPGHHALRDRAMGFCLLANAVVGARAALRSGCSRVLIVDWDVHHGNGTQALVEAEPAIRFVSLHQWPWWPGTGAADERGSGNIFNVPRPPGLPADRYVGDLWSAVERATSGWTPDLIIVSAGFDAMKGDPLGGFTLEPSNYEDLTVRLRALGPRAPVVGLMEGGYIPARLAEGVAAHVRTLA